MRVSKMTVYRLVHSGELPAVRFGRSFRVPESAVADAIGVSRLAEVRRQELHVWQREPSLEGAKTIAGAIRSAIHSARLTLAPGLHCADARVSSMRFLRDPDGEHSHGVVVVEVLVSEERA